MFKKNLYIFCSVVCLSLNNTYAMEKEDQQSYQKKSKGYLRFGYSGPKTVEQEEEEEAEWKIERIIRFKQMFGLSLVENFFLESSKKTSSETNTENVDKK